MLFSISCDHPDVEEFIQVKSDYTKIQNANISVQCTEKFYKAVENDEDWELRFEVPALKKGDRIYIDVHSIDMNCVREKETGRYYHVATHDRKKEVFSKIVKARKLMELIAKNMHSNAEPGIQNIDVARKYSNSDALYDPADEYDSRILSTNACSEQYLSRESLCVLASLNCGRFSSNRETFISQLNKIGHSMNRFLDNVNECELVYQTFATPHQALAIRKLRRTGAGVTNIAAWLFKRNLEYGTKEANDSIEEFIKWYNYWLYVSSEEIGAEKGDFGLFNKEKWRNAPFVARMIKESEKLNAEFKVPIIKGTHARNVTVSSIAPTGTLSLMFRDFVLSYGIEPAFFMYFWKRTRVAGKYEYYFCVPRVIRDAFAEAGIPIPMTSDTIKDTWDGKIGTPIAKFIEEHRHKFKFKESPEINPMDKLNLMAQVMKWVDSSISVTYMLPIGSTWKDVYNFILEAHKKEVKSIAAFPDKKLYGIVSNISFRELAFKLKSEGVGMHHQNFSDDELAELNFSRESVHEITQVRPARPPILEADAHVVTVKGQKFVMVVGILNGKPYEMFGGHINGFGFKFQTKKCKMRKVKTDQYALEIDDIEIDDFSKQFTSTEQILFRFVSLSLGSGLPIQEVVDQLQKGAMDITSMGAAAARVLKKYITNGTSAGGKQCPNCKSIELVYHDGCIHCKCGWSACS
jgi:ribonucleoside-diphosphate reductase alpha chain